MTACLSLLTHPWSPAPGYLAMRMGLPLEKLLLATNENDVIAKFFRTGVWSAAQRGFSIDTK